MAIYSVFSHKNMVIFHSYVSLPEGKSIHFQNQIPVAMTMGEQIRAVGPYILGFFEH
jgi:hypothetical protein